MRRVTFCESPRYVSQSDESNLTDDVKSKYAEGTDASHQSTTTRVETTTRLEPIDICSSPAEATTVQLPTNSTQSLSAYMHQYPMLNGSMLAASEMATTTYGNNEHQQQHRHRQRWDTNVPVMAGSDMNRRQCNNLSDVCMRREAASNRRQQNRERQQSMHGKTSIMMVPGICINQSMMCGGPSIPETFGRRNSIAESGKVSHNNASFNQSINHSISRKKKPSDVLFQDHCSTLPSHDLQGPVSSNRLSSKVLKGHLSNLNGKNTLQDTHNVSFSGRHKVKGDATRNRRATHQSPGMQGYPFGGRFRSHFQQRSFGIRGGIDGPGSDQQQWLDEMIFRRHYNNGSCPKGRMDSISHSFCNMNLEAGVIPVHSNHDNSILPQSMIHPPQFWNHRARPGHNRYSDSILFNSSKNLPSPASTFPDAGGLLPGINSGFDRFSFNPRHTLQSNQKHQLQDVTIARSTSKPHKLASVRSTGRHVRRSVSRTRLELAGLQSPISDNCPSSNRRPPKHKTTNAYKKYRGEDFKQRSISIDMFNASCEDLGRSVSKTRRKHTRLNDQSFCSHSPSATTTGTVTDIRRSHSVKRSPQPMKTCLKQPNSGRRKTPSPKLVDQGVMCSIIPTKLRSTPSQEPPGSIEYDFANNPTTPIMSRNGAIMSYSEDHKKLNVFVQTGRSTKPQHAGNQNPYLTGEGKKMCPYNGDDLTCGIDIGNNVGVDFTDLRLNRCEVLVKHVCQNDVKMSGGTASTSGLISEPDNSMVVSF